MGKYAKHATNVPKMAAPPPPLARALLPVGTEVEIEDLMRLPEFNGRTGVVCAWGAEAYRYEVILHSLDESCGANRVKVKGENLRPRVPPPPCSAPTLHALCSDSDGSEDEDVPRTPRWEEDEHPATTSGWASI